MYPKWFIKSKTVIVNALVLLATVIVEFSAFGPDFSLDPKHVVMAVTAANIILRFTTSDPVTVSKPSVPEGQ